MIKILKDNETDDEGFKIRLQGPEDVFKSQAQGPGGKNIADLKTIQERGSGRRGVGIGGKPFSGNPQLNKDLSAALYSRQMQEEEE